MKAFTEQLYRKAEKADAISLDIFDTALLRCAEKADDVFQLLENTMVHQHGNRWKGLAQARRRADPVARGRAWEQSQSEEVSLEDLYACVGEMNADWAGADNRQLLIKTELTLEKSLIVSNPLILEFYKAMRKTGKPVYFISDIYLPAPFVEALLQVNGYKGWRKAYISSAIGKVKYLGSLYRHVIDDLKDTVSPGQILHIGDNPESDGAKAAEHGFQTLVAPKASTLLGKHQATQKLRRLWEETPAQAPIEACSRSLHLGMLANRMAGMEVLEPAPDERDEASQFWSETGFSIAGPLCHGFARWLLDEAKRLQVPRLFFLSRDGDILKRVYDLCAKGDADAPPSAYIHASRRALVIAAIEALSTPVMDFLANGIHMTVADYLRRIDLDPARHAREIGDCGFSGPDHKVYSGEDYSNIRKLFQKLETEILASARRERETYLAYLRSEGMMDSNRIGIVDVGWLCSMQQSFENLLLPGERDLRIDGFYMGTYAHAATRQSEHSKIHSWFLRMGEPEENYLTLRHGIGVFEHLFVSDENTFIRMENHSGTFTPRLADNHENASAIPFIRAMREGILDYAKACVGSGLPGFYWSDPAAANTAFSVVSRLLRSPTGTEARHIGNLYYPDGYGNIYFTRQFARPAPLIQNFLHPSQFKDHFKKCFWRRGFYERLSLPERLLLRAVLPRKHQFYQLH